MAEGEQAPDEREAVPPQVGAGEDAAQPYELRSARYEIRRSTEELDRAGVEKYDNRERYDSTDDSEGSEWSTQRRITLLAAERDRLAVEVERLRAHRKKLLAERDALEDFLDACDAIAPFNGPEANGRYYRARDEARARLAAHPEKEAEPNEPTITDEQVRALAKARWEVDADDEVRDGYEPIRWDDPRMMSGERDIEVEKMRRALAAARRVAASPDLTED